MAAAQSQVAGASEVRPERTARARRDQHQGGGRLRSAAQLRADAVGDEDGAMTPPADRPAPGPPPAHGVPIGTIALLVLAVLLYAAMLGSLTDAGHTDA